MPSWAATADAVAAVVSRKVGVSSGAPRPKKTIPRRTFFLWLRMCASKK